MNIMFDEKTKEGLKGLLEKSTEDNIRIKAFFGCGKPAYEIYCDYKKDTDIFEVIDGINFIIDTDHIKACDNIQIKYDKDIYHNGFYIRPL